MATYTTDQEQMQLIRDWLKKYAPSVVIGIILALAISFGWRYWQQQRIQKMDQSSLLYEQMLIAQSTHQASQFTQVANDLVKNYPHTSYAAFASLLLAQQAVNNHDLTTARQQLQRVIAQTSNDILKQLATVRLARIFIAQNQAQDALNLLKTVDDKKAYAAEAHIIRGDAYVALQKNAEAKAAYQTALNELPVNAPLRSVVQMKVDQL